MLIVKYLLNCIIYLNVCVPIMEFVILVHPLFSPNCTAKVAVCFCVVLPLGTLFTVVNLFLLSVDFVF